MPEPSDRALDPSSLRRLLDDGELLLAYDGAVQLLAAHESGEQTRQPAEVMETQYLAVLALARSRATHRAQELFAAYGLDRAGERGATGHLAVDLPALEARIAKDRALAAVPALRRALSREAAGRYEAVYQRHQGAYPCINAATMWLVAGDDARAARLARAAATLTSGWARDDVDYWTVATAAEAALLLDDVATAEGALTRAGELSSGQYATRAVSRRQLALVCRLRGLPLDLLKPLDNPGVIHFTGHRISQPGHSGRFPAECEADIADRVARHLAGSGIGFGYGSLASGADILVAEALLAAGSELHVILPFGIDEFVRASVADSGGGWIERFHTCLTRAGSVTYASDGEYLHDPVMFGFCSAVAMGQAVQRADHLNAEVAQVAIWDQAPGSAEAVAGTAADVARWQATGHPCTVISPRQPGSLKRGATGSTPPEEPRVVRAMLFADIAGFSKLTDAQIPVFIREVMQPLADTVDRFNDDVLLRMTWGDGLYLVFPGVTAAAGCALALQDTMRRLDLAGLGLDVLGGMRIGGHVGPVFEGWDPVRRELNFFGANVTRAARIEPRTPEGEVYVTHPFSALVTLEGDGRWSCQYVGRVPAAKDYGVLPMFVLKSAV